MRSAVVRILLCVSVLSLCTGCFMAPVMDAVSRVGITAGDRRALLDERVALVRNAFSWQRKDDLLTLTEAEKQPELSKTWRSYFKDRKIVDVTLAALEMDPGATESTAELAIRSYRVPYFIVTEETKFVTMSFHVSSGWLIQGFLDKAPVEVVGDT